jgi:hypothetical protein
MHRSTTPGRKSMCIKRKQRQARSGCQTRFKGSYATTRQSLSQSSTSTEFPFGLRGEADEWVPLYYDVRLHNSTDLWERKKDSEHGHIIQGPAGSIEFEVGLGRKASDVTVGTPYNSKRWPSEGILSYLSGINN